MFLNKVTMLSLVTSLFTGTHHSQVMDRVFTSYKNMSFHFKNCMIFQFSVIHDEAKDCLLNATECVRSP